MFAHYVHDETEGASENYAIINAADLTGVSGVSDLTSSTTGLEVVGIAQLVGITAGSLNALSNFTATKPSAYEGA